MAQLGKLNIVQMVNEGLQVFDKLTGTSLLGPIHLRSIWIGFGDTCYTNAGAGDPSSFTIGSLTGGYQPVRLRPPARTTARTSVSLFRRPATPPVSGTDTTSGSDLSFRMHDYPKLGVWPDGYYMSAIDTQFRGPMPPMAECYLG